MSRVEIIFCADFWALWGPGDFLPENSSSGCGNSPVLLLACFTGHRHVGDVTADFSCKQEKSNLDTDVYGAVKYNKVQRACTLLFTNLNGHLNHNMCPGEGSWNAAEIYQKKIELDRNSFKRKTLFVHSCNYTLTWITCCNDEQMCVVLENVQNKLI